MDNKPELFKGLFTCYYGALRLWTAALLIRAQFIMALFTMRLTAAAHHSIEKVSITARHKSPHAPGQVPMTIIVSDARWKRRSFHIS